MLYNKDFVKSLVTITRSIQITIEFQFYYFVLLLTLIDMFHQASIMASIPSETFYNDNWIKIHKNHCFQVKQESINSIKIGNSIVVDLTRYTNIWNNFFGNRFINLGISGDREMFFGVLEIFRFFPSLKNTVIVAQIISIKISLMALLKV